MILLPLMEENGAVVQDFNFCSNATKAVSSIAPVMTPTDISMLLNNSGCNSKIAPNPSIMLPDINFNNRPCCSDSLLLLSVRVNTITISNNGII